MYSNHSNTWIHVFTGVTSGPEKYFGPIGSAVLRFIGHKQTDRQTTKLCILYIELLNSINTQTNGNKEKRLIKKSFSLITCKLMLKKPC